MLEIIAADLGLLLIFIALYDAFETIVLPRRVKREVRLTRIVVRSTWRPWRAFATRLPATSGDTMLSFYGPLSLILLIGVWAALLVVGFGLASWGFGAAITPAGNEAGLGDHLYLSGSTFFTLGIGDVRPESTFSRIVTVVEAGSGLGFLALVLTYVPVLYQAFSRREINVSLLDARAGSPPSADEFFRRLGGQEGMDSLIRLLEEWERWAAELLETHLSYGLLLLYRSQHERQSWLAALTLVLDVSALVLSSSLEEDAKRRARLTFAIARHAAVDLSQVVFAHPTITTDRLPPADFEKLVAADRELLGGVSEEVLRDLRKNYEPNVAALSRLLEMPLPNWLAAKGQDAWESSPWQEGV
jgi:Ion channel